jgi:hypothetical protein
MQAATDSTIIRPPQPAGRLGALTPAAASGAILLAGAVGGVVAVRLGAKLPIAAAVGVIAVASGIASWRRSIKWLLYYLPFAGLLPLALYPRQGPATLLKDFAFVLPAYVGALLMVLRRRVDLRVPRLPGVLFGAFTALVVVEGVNPRLARPLIGPIGMKVWLFYLPLLPLGYHMFDHKRGLQHLLKWLTILALVPCVLGLIEAAMVYGGKSGFVYSLYGSAAAATSQNFFTIGLGSGHLTRLSSIFTFVAQYYFFASATVVVAYAAWRGNRSDPLMRRLGPAAIVIALFATLTSGLRAAFVFGPILLVLIALLEGVSIRRVLAATGVPVVAIVGTVLALGIPLLQLASLTGSHTSDLLGFFGHGTHFALHHAVLGIGSGADTNQARYAFPVLDYHQIYAPLGGIWYESWYLKALIELGVIGLLLFALLVSKLVARSIAAHRAAFPDPESRSMSAAFLALFIWTLLFSIKTAAIDEDPLDIYVWLFLGLQWRIGDMVRSQSRRAS